MAHGCSATRSPLTNARESDNIDYDEIKAFIKEHTTPGKGKTVPIPGQTDEKLLDFEIALFKIFKEQHDRIGMFVKSKAGEIRRRIGKLMSSICDLRFAVTADY